MYKDVKSLLGNRKRKKIANNTYLELRCQDEEDEYIVMALHGNVVAEFNKDGVRLWSCGWRTVTTKNRLNMALRLADIPGKLRVYQSDWTWYLGDYNIPKDTSFREGMLVGYDGSCV